MTAPIVHVAGGGSRQHSDARHAVIADLHRADFGHIVVASDVIPDLRRKITGAHAPNALQFAMTDKP